jgi:hypothetical protein
VLGWPRVWLALAASAPLLLAVGRLLPAEGPGLAFRLAGAAGCVLLLPGACPVHFLDLRASIGVQLAAALAWSLAAIFTFLVLTFAVGASLSLVVGLLGVATAVGFILSLRTAGLTPEREDVLAAVALVAVGAVLAGALWWATETIGGSLGPSVSDALFHLGRIRKLDELGSLDSIDVMNEIDGEHVHPGYAFPLWHGALALIARLAGVDPTLVVLYLPAILVPLTLLVTYGAGRALFGSEGGGVATVIGWLALFVLPFGGVGSLQYLAQPGGASRFLLVPAVLALVFAFVADRRPALLACTSACALALAVIHPTYVVFLAVLLGGFFLARAVLDGPHDLRRIAAALGALVVPSALFFAWLVQFVGDTRRSQAQFPQEVETIGSAMRLRPDQLAWGGGTKVVALAAIALALLAAGRRWAAYVVGGFLALMLIALVPPLFDPFADAISISQAKRIASFLPLPFALAGLAVLAGRLRVFGVGAALAAGFAAELAFRAPATGAGWLVWSAAVAAALGLVAFGFARARAPREPGSRWAVLAAIALALPAAVSGFAGYERWDNPDPYGLSPGVTAALRTDVDPLAVVLAPSFASYRIVGYAPVRIVVNPHGHVALDDADYDARAQSVQRFFFEPGVTHEEQQAVLDRYSVSWVLVDRSRGTPTLPEGLTRVYADDRYVLYRVDAREEPA